MAVGSIGRQDLLSGSNAKDGHILVQLARWSFPKHVPQTETGSRNDTDVLDPEKSYVLDVVLLRELVLVVEVVVV